MATRRTTYLNLPALTLIDPQLGISLIITAMRAKLIMDAIDDIRDFLNEFEVNIDQEKVERINERANSKSRFGRL